MREPLPKREPDAIDDMRQNPTRFLKRATQISKPRPRKPDWLDYLICAILLGGVILIAYGIYLFVLWSPRTL